LHGCGKEKKTRQGLGLGFKEKGRERETAAGAIAIDGRGGRRRLDVLQGEGGVTEGEIEGRERFNAPPCSDEGIGRRGELETRGKLLLAARG
jgi:hypothetical protein